MTPEESMPKNTRERFIFHMAWSWAVQTTVENYRTTERFEFQPGQKIQSYEQWMASQYRRLIYGPEQHES